MGFGLGFGLGVWARVRVGVSAGAGIGAGEAGRWAGAQPASQPVRRADWLAGENVGGQVRPAQKVGRQVSFSLFEKVLLLRPRFLELRQWPVPKLAVLACELQRGTAAGWRQSMAPGTTAFGHHHRARSALATTAWRGAGLCVCGLRWQLLASTGVKGVGFTGTHRAKSPKILANLGELGVQHHPMRLQRGYDAHLQVRLAP